MDKEKDIEEMTKIISTIHKPMNFGMGIIAYPDDGEIARRLQDAGYGNIEHAVREFADELKKNILKHFPTLFTDAIYQFIDSQLDDLIKVRFGGEEV